MKKMKMSLAIAAIVVGAVAVPAGAANASDLGGWSEETGSFSTSSAPTGVSVRAAAASTVKHTGKAEETVKAGTTNKRAHGWTTWAGVYHYTTARMETYSGSVVYNTSGRQWGTSGTEAISPWRAATKADGTGSARTYYGK